MNKRHNFLWVIVIAATLCGLAGCGAPSASLDLITVARSGLASARQVQAGQQAQLVQRMDAQTAALDSAFDADVRLVAAGAVKDESGTAVALSPDWVISARKGYAAARDAIAQQKQSAQAASAVNLDNLKAADEALEMASQLIAQQADIGQRLRQQLLAAQNRIVAK